MAEPMPASELDAIRERGPVGYHCDHSDEPTGTSHHEWEWVEGEGLVFQPAPSVSMSLTHPKNRAGSGDSWQCPRAVPVYAVDAPALARGLHEAEAEAADLEQVVADLTAKNMGLLAERDRFRAALEEIAFRSIQRDLSALARTALDAPSTTEEGER
ncbi:hypothetical protein [Streptosporangium sp. G12]